ncbi:complement C1q subcomponent subunit B-like [Dreissena polymorpha]|uniref:C1q domain-containing protein n=1 Tax=Dreissena polymorpha TaxID=45954 RepID=A0A9D4S304_DREPO|nr:complement C1q subcomponent subunit B-like [Dreissena polymorpha]KAH3889876.1 hypothetical protein DPMN_013942 [Dreissena polymorpha]
MMLMLIAAVFVQVFLTTGHAMSVTGLDDNVSAMEQLLTMVPERTTDEMYQQLQKQLKIHEERIERKEQRNGPSDYATAVNVNTPEVVVGSQAYSNRSRVVFTALKQADQSSIGVNQRITFEKVILNVGNGYRARSGIFIVPTSGIYMFSVTLTTTGSVYAALVHTEGTIAEIVCYNTYDSCSHSVFVNLAEHDHVWVENIINSGRYVYGSSRSSFSGILVA